LKILFESQLSRMNCQIFSCGFSSGHLAGNGINVMLGGTIRLPERCHPGRLSIDQALRPMSIELENPITNDLGRHAADLGHLCARSAFVNRRQG
jgi:hypothetical protein